eukprot:jgi/Botrbrau1/11315/Bobra.0038s0076.1
MAKQLSKRLILSFCRECRIRQYIWSIERTVSTLFNREGQEMEMKPRLSPDGKPAVTGFSKEFKEIYGRNFFILGWHEIRQVLYENLPADTVEHGRRVTGYEDDGSGFIRLKFKDEEGEEVRARILIGADGYRSRIRRQLLADGDPEFQNLVMWRARVPLSLSEPGFKTSTWWRDGDVAPSPIVRFIAFVKMTADSAALVVSSPIAEMKKRGVEYDPTKASTSSIQSDGVDRHFKERCLATIEDFDPRVLRLIEAIDADRFTEHGLFKRDINLLPDEGFGRGGVTLVGDATHMGPPNGLGVNLAMEDAAVLGQNLRLHGITLEALRRYEAERVPRVKEILSKTSEFAETQEKIDLLYKASFPSLKVPVAVGAANNGLEHQKLPTVAVHRTGLTSTNVSQQLPRTKQLSCHWVKGSMRNLSPTYLMRSTSVALGHAHDGQHFRRRRSNPSNTGHCVSQIGVRFTVTTLPL